MTAAVFGDSDSLSDLFEARMRATNNFGRLYMLKIRKSIMNCEMRCTSVCQRSSMKYVTIVYTQWYYCLTFQICVMKKQLLRLLLQNSDLCVIRMQAKCMVDSPKKHTPNIRRNEAIIIQTSDIRNGYKFKWVLR